MSFDLPLTAFALESTGAAALAPGEAHTLTLAVTTAAAAALAPLASDDAGEAPHGVRVQADAPPPLTLTF